jgi:hypothetical protein
MASPTIQASNQTGVGQQRLLTSLALGRTPTAISRAMVQQYRSVLESAGLASASINLRLSAIRKLAAEAAENQPF